MGAVADWVWWQWLSALSVAGIVWGAGAIVVALLFGQVVRLRDKGGPE